MRRADVAVYSATWRVCFQPMALTAAPPWNTTSDRACAASAQTIQTVLPSPDTASATGAAPAPAEMVSGETSSVCVSMA